MKKYYQFGEIMLALREEYRECKHLLEELDKCVRPDQSAVNYNFTGLLSYDDNSESIDDRKIRLLVEKRYNEVIKKIHHITGNTYGADLYRAIFNAEKQENGLYGLKLDDYPSPYQNIRYIPEVKIKEQVKFSELVEKLFSSDLMKAKRRSFEINHDSVSVDFRYAMINSTLGDAYIYWDSQTDNFDYSTNEYNNPYLLDEIFELEIPADRISDDWLKILEKHEDIFDKELSFIVDRKAQSKKGTLQFFDIEKGPIVNTVQFLKKYNR